MMTLPAGTELYTIYAIASPKAPEVKIGTIVLKSKFTTSKFGDENLFFEHWNMAEDIKIHPEWDSDTPKYEGILDDEAHAAGCPFAKFLGMN
jgi:hypothetical protein